MEGDDDVPKHLLNLVSDIISMDFDTLYEHSDSFTEQIFITNEIGQSSESGSSWSSKIYNSMDVNNIDNNRTSPDDYLNWSNDLKFTFDNAKSFSNLNEPQTNVDESKFVALEPQGLSENGTTLLNISNGYRGGDAGESVVARGVSILQNCAVGAARRVEAPDRNDQTLHLSDVKTVGGDGFVVDDSEHDDRVRQRNNVYETGNGPSRKRKLAPEDDASDALNGDDGKRVLMIKDPTKLTSDGNRRQRNGDENKNQTKSGCTSRMPAWQVDDITDNLAADLDGSLSGLGADSYNVNEALLSLPSLQVFKQEAPSPTNQDGGAMAVPTALQQIHHQRARQSPTSSTQAGIGPMQTVEPDSNSNGVNGSLHRLLGTFSPGLNNGTGMVSSSALEPAHQDPYIRNGVSSSSSCGNVTPGEYRFQYVLGAATSIATKVNEDTLTYLNQGQSYEIKLKKLGDLSACKGKTLTSVIGICFHERRMQYSGRERLSQWQSGRPGDRVLEVDVPLSYGLSHLQQPSLNTVTFNWDPTVPVGVYIKVNCISTEFTPKKHGGEKGVPFRIQIETYLYEPEDIPNPNNTGKQPQSVTQILGKRLHAGACQIKVFKLKGADRKHKQDREKIMKRPPCEQEKYQPSYECTVLNDISCDDSIYPSIDSTLSPSIAAPLTIQSAPPPPSNVYNMSNCLVPSSSCVKGEDPVNSTAPEGLALTCSTTNIVSESKTQIASIDSQTYQNAALSPEASSEQTVAWLNANRFAAYIATFASFSGADVLRLSRDDLIQICGLADGIRLYNALHAKSIAPKLTLYICMEQSSVFNAMYLNSYNNAEFSSKLSILMGISRDRVQDYFVRGPNGIHILINEDVIRNFKNETMFTVDIVQDVGKYRVLLKPCVSH